jgi:hypothetical protein
VVTASYPHTNFAGQVRIAVEDIDKAMRLIS